MMPVPHPVGPRHAEAMEAGSAGGGKVYWGWYIVAGFAVLGILVLIVAIPLTHLFTGRTRPED